MCVLFLVFFELIWCIQSQELWFPGVMDISTISENHEHVDFFLGSES